MKYESNALIRTETIFGMGCTYVWNMPTKPGHNNRFIKTCKQKVWTQFE